MPTPSPIAEALMDQYFPRRREGPFDRGFLLAMRDMQAELIKHKLEFGGIRTEDRDRAIATVVRLTINRNEDLV